MEQTEIKLPSNLLEELAMRKAAVANAQRFIDEETEKYKKTIRDAEIFKEREEREIGSMRDVVVYVDLEKFIEALAQEWGVSSKNIVVNVGFFNTSRHGSKVSKELFIKLHENGSSEIGKLCAHITINTKNKSHYLEINPILNLLDVQKDGSRLKDFLEVESKQSIYSNKYYVTDFVCPDYKNLIIRFDFDRLVDFNSCEFDSRISELLFEARVEKDLVVLDK